MLYGFLNWVRRLRIVSTIGSAEKRIDVSLLRHSHPNLRAAAYQFLLDRPPDDLLCIEKAITPGIDDSQEAVRMRAGHLTLRLAALGSRHCAAHRVAAAIEATCRGAPHVDGMLNPFIAVLTDPLIFDGLVDAYRNDVPTRVRELMVGNLAHYLFSEKIAWPYYANVAAAARFLGALGSQARSGGAHLFVALCCRTAHAPIQDSIAAAVEQTGYDPQAVEALLQKCLAGGVGMDGLFSAFTLNLFGGNHITRRTKYAGRDWTKEVGPTGFSARQLGRVLEIGQRYPLCFASGRG